MPTEQGRRPRQAAPNLNVTFPINVTFGAFQVGEYRVPFLNSVLRAQQVAEWLNLVTDDPKYAQQDWKVEELFQRDISYPRIIEIANKYLDPGFAEKPPFFNSLTVVLTSKNNGMCDFAAPPQSEYYDHCVNIGPVTVSFEEKDGQKNYPRPGSFGTVQWNRDETYGVAIDGQHRLAAIKHLWRNNPEVAKQIYLSVIFIVIDPKLGFQARKGEPFNATSYMRSIFIDLNKHNVPVSRTRNILLDDLDPMALFVRSLISPSLAFEEKDGQSNNGLQVGTADEFVSCIPLNLVDWHSDAKSKVDVGPYITSILGLDWIVNTALKKCSAIPTKPINIAKSDPDEEHYYNNIRVTLKSWKKTWEVLLQKHIDDCEEYDHTFIFTKEELGKIQDEFGGQWGRPITRLLTTAACYRDLVRIRMTNNIISPQFGQWYQLYDAHKIARDDGTKQHYHDKLSNVEESLTTSGINVKSFRKSVEEIDEFKEGRILFYIVGQRAFFHSLVMLLNEKKIVHWSQNIEVDLDAFKDCVHDFCAYYLVEAINVLYSQFSHGTEGFFEKSCKIPVENQIEQARGVRKEFWAGALVKRDNPTEMDFSDIAALRSARWFVLVAHMYWFLKCNYDNSEVTKEKIVNAVDDLSYFDQFDILGSDICAAIGSLINDGNVNSAPMTFLAKVNIDDPDNKPDEVAKLALAATKERLGYLLDMFGEAGLLKG